MSRRNNRAKSRRSANREPNRYSRGGPGNLVNSYSTNSADAEGSSTLSKDNLAPKSESQRLKTPPPSGGKRVIEHIDTFASRLNAYFSKLYHNPDEAYRQSRQQASMMRRDPVCMEPLRERQMGTALLEWQIVPEDEKDPVQKEVCKKLTTLVKKTPDFLKMRMALLEAVWFGRYAVNTIYQWGGRKEKFDELTVREWMPIHGDKLTWEYGTGRVGIMNGWVQHGNSDDQRFGPESRVMLLDDRQRESVIVHTHEVEDGEFFDPFTSGAIHGLGLRNRVYWPWFLKQKLLQWMMDFGERSGLGVQIWYFEAGNKTSEDAARDAAEKYSNENVLLVPMPMGNERGTTPPYERIEAGMGGAQFFQTLMDEYFGQQIKRMIIGQTLSSEQGGGGLGDGVAKQHADTKQQYIRFDSINLSETLTREFIRVMARWNFPGIDWEPRFEIIVDDVDSDKVLRAAKIFQDMGGELGENQVREIIGLGKPDATDRILEAVKQDPFGGAGGAGSGVNPFGQTPSLETDSRNGEPGKFSRGADSTDDSVDEDSAIQAIISAFEAGELTLEDAADAYQAILEDDIDSFAGDDGEPAKNSKSYRDYSRSGEPIRFSWNGPHTGPRGGIYWLNDETGSKTYRKTKPGSGRQLWASTRKMFKVKSKAGLDAYKGAREIHAKALDGKISVDDAVAKFRELLTVKALMDGAKGKDVKDKEPTPTPSPNPEPKPMLSLEKEPVVPKEKPNRDTATPKEVLDIALENIGAGYISTPYAPVWKIREQVAEQIGEKAASHEVLDGVLKQMHRDGKIRLTAIADRSRSKPEHLRAGIEGSNETFYYVEIPEPEHDHEDSMAKSKEMQAENKGWASPSERDINHAIEKVAGAGAVETEGTPIWAVRQAIKSWLWSDESASKGVDKTLKAMHEAGKIKLLEIPESAAAADGKLTKEQRAGGIEIDGKTYYAVAKGDGKKEDKSADVSDTPKESKPKRAYLSGQGAFLFRAILKDKGWKWDDARKAWWKEGEWEDDKHVEKHVREYGGIRNRSSFKVQVE